jgi:hypothetical protein
MLKKWMVGVAVGVLGVAVAPVVHAQSKAPAPASVRRPYRGLFGAPPAPDSPQSLTLTGSVFGAYDDNVLAGLSDRQVRNPFLQQSGEYAGADAGLNYSLEKESDRLTVGALTAGQVRYTRRPAATSTTPNVVADLHLDWRVTRSTTVLVRESAAYSSRYNFSLTPLQDDELGSDIAQMNDPAFDIFDLRVERSASSIFIKQQLRKDTTVSAGYLFRQVDVIDDALANGRFHDYRTSAAVIGIIHSRRLSPHAELQLGYNLRLSDRQSLTGEPGLVHHLDAGVNYSRPLSFSRRTTVSFDSGSSIIPPSRRADGTSDPRTRIRLTGNANIVQEMGRTWTAQMSYARGLKARDGFGDLYFTDAIFATVEGLVTRRLSWTSTARWSMSSLDRPGRNQHRAASATSQLTFGLTRVFGVFARYVYYEYRYGEDIPLDPRLPGQLDRQGVRVGLTTSLPLIR